MKQSKNPWGRYLALYGIDFKRWPEKPDQRQESLIKTSQDYQEACAIDNALEAAAWPAPSEGLYLHTLEKIRQQDNAPANQIPMLIVLERPAFFFGILFIALFLGITSGTQYNAVLSQGREYSYFAVGSAYAYNIAAEVGRDHE